MEWTSMDPIGASFILGDWDGDTYTPADDCDELLEEMLESLINDDPRTGAFRRRIGMEKVLEKDLIPLLRSTNDEKIFGLAVRFMANLTQPFEVTAPVPGNTPSTPKDLDALLTDVKHLCTDVNFFKTFGYNIKQFLNKPILQEGDRQCLHHSVLFLRNLLHMRHGTGDDEHIFIAHQCLLSSFFMNELDKIIVSLLQHEDKECWTIGIAQLISFIFKDYSGSLLEPDLDDNTSNSSGEENQNMVEILLTEGTPNNTHHPRHPNSTNVSTTKTLTNNFKKNLHICSTTGGSACSLPMDDDDFMLEIKSTQDGRLEIKLANPTSVTLEGDSGSGGGGGGGGGGSGSRGSRGSSEDVSGVGAVGRAKGDSQTNSNNNHNNNSSSSNSSCVMKSPRDSSTSLHSMTKSHSGSSGARGAAGGVAGGGSGGSGSGSRSSPANALSVSNVDMEKDVMSTINASSCLMDMDIFIAYLKKFATDIVYTGLLDLVENLMKALLTRYETILDHSLLLWTVGFFLSFSQQQELDLEQIRGILNLDLFGFLVYEGVKTCESLVVKGRNRETCAAEKHRLHLVVCTLNQMFRTLMTNNKTKPVSEYLYRLQKYLGSMSDLRNLFVLLIRLQSSWLDQGQTYLCDLVQTNHVLMMMMEDWLATGILQEDSEFSLLAHVNQFATCKVMAKYGSLLEQEDGNRETLNVAVLTMMYHVAGSCQRHDTLLQLPILKVFTEIWMENAVRGESKARAAAKSHLGTSALYEHEFKDLIEFVLKIFMDNADKASGAFAERLFANSGSHASQEETSSLDSMNTDSGLFSKDFGEEELVLIVSWMGELSGREDAASIITKRLRDHGYDQSVEQVKKYLEENGLLLPRDAGQAEEAAPALAAAGAAESNDKMTKVLQELSLVPENDMIAFLVGKVKEEGHETQLVWLQKQLIEAAYVKQGLQEPSIRVHVEEPVARFYALQNKSIPLVPWSQEAEQALATPYFLILQKCLGLYTNDDPSILFPRIPQYLTPMLLVDMASRIGPIESLSAKFDLTSLKEEPVTRVESGHDGDGQSPDSTTSARKDITVVRPSKPLPQYHWLRMIQTMNQAAVCSSTS